MGTPRLELYLICYSAQGIQTACGFSHQKKKPENFGKFSRLFSKHMIL